MIRKCSNFFDPALPLPPSGLRVIGRTDSMTDTSIDLAWDAPEGDGAESLVDHYILSISPPPLSAPMETVVPASPWSTVLISSIEVYTASVTAVNCNGNSAALTLNINLSKCMLWMGCWAIGYILLRSYSADTNSTSSRRQLYPAVSWRYSVFPLCSHLFSS